MFSEFEYLLPVKNLRLCCFIFAPAFWQTRSDKSQIINYIQQEALVGEDSGEQQLFSSENTSSKGGIDVELDGYLKKFKVLFLSSLLPLTFFHANIKKGIIFLRPLIVDTYCIQEL